jgi:hypothetical protein
MGTIAAVYSGYVQHGGTGDQLVVTYEGPGDEEYGEYTIKRTWVTEHAAGELSDRQLLNRIQDTLVQGEPPTTEREG